MFIYLYLNPRMNWKNSYISVTAGQKEAYTLNDDGIILTEQMARFLNVKAGDTVTIMDGDTKEIPVTVTAVSKITCTTMPT